MAIEIQAKNPVIRLGVPGPQSNVQPDWNQQDSTAKDYIKNKIGYREIFTKQTGVCTIENIEANTLYLVQDLSIEDEDTLANIRNNMRYSNVGNRFPTIVPRLAFWVYFGTEVALSVNFNKNNFTQYDTSDEYNYYSSEESYRFYIILDRTKLSSENAATFPKDGIYFKTTNANTNRVSTAIYSYHRIDTLYLSSSVATTGELNEKQDTLIQSGASVGQIAKITAVDSSGKPTAWQAVDMPSGGGHWETVLDTVWEQDVITPTAFDAETGIFTCAEGELDNLELDTEYIFYQQCVAEGVAYNTILNTDYVKVTKLSDTTFSIDSTPPTTFVPTNVKFSKGACLAVTDIEARKIRLTLDGQFHPTATRYDYSFYGAGKSYFGMNTGYIQIRNAYQAYQQVTAEVESPYRIVGKILCGFNAPSNSGNLHFKNNSFCCPLVPYVMPEGNTRPYFLNSDGTKIAKLYSPSAPWAPDSVKLPNDYLKIISGTKVKLERWVE